MPIITKIEQQKKNKKRFSIFLDGEYSFGAGEEIVFKYNFKEGLKIEEKKIKEIIFEEEKRSARNYAYKLLGLRARSEKEIHNKLKQKGYDENIILEVIKTLKNYNYLNDIEFAEHFATDRVKNKKIGEKLLRVELFKKGIPEKIINETIKKVFSENNELELAKELVKKKMPHLKNLEPLKAKKKLSDFLLRKGFDWDVISQVVKIEETGLE
jgi:regulatory protein